MIWPNLKVMDRSNFEKSIICVINGRTKHICKTNCVYQNRNISKSGKLISDLIEITNI